MEWISRDIEEDRDSIIDDESEDMSLDSCTSSIGSIRVEKSPLHDRLDRRDMRELRPR